MAYAYSQIDNLLQNQQQNNANIFQQGQQGQGGQQQGQGQQGQQGQNPVITSTDADSTGGGGGGGNSNSAGSSSSGSSHAPAFNNFQTSDSAAVGAAANKTQAPSALGQVSQQLHTADQGLQDAANSYVTTGKAGQSYSIPTGDIDKAIGGDPGTSSSVTSLLNRSTINPVADFKAPSVTAADSGNLATDAGLQQLVARGQRPTYTSGDAAFDLGALHRTNGFNGQVSGLQGQQADLQQKANDLQISQPKAVSDYGTGQLQLAQGDAKGYLTGKSSAIDANDQAQADAKNAALAALRNPTAPDAAGQAAVLQGLQDVDKNYTGDKTAWNYQDSLHNAGVNPNLYRTVHGDYGASDFTTGDEAKQYNQIQALLGLGGSRVAAGALGPDVTYDQAGLESGIGSELARLLAIPVSHTDPVKEQAAADKENAVIDQKYADSPLSQGPGALTQDGGFQKNGATAGTLAIPDPANNYSHVLPAVQAPVDPNAPTFVAPSNQPGFSTSSSTGVTFAPTAGNLDPNKPNAPLNTERPDEFAAIRSILGNGLGGYFGSGF